MTRYYIGLMSGTSTDGVDGVLVDFAPGGERALRVLAHEHRAFEPSLRDAVLELNRPGKNELHRAALIGNTIARLSAIVVEMLLARSGVARAEISAIGVHGQTVRHCPGAIDGTGYTIQINAPALLAELTGIDVVCDFRSRDLAAGGQGAPLVPAFHGAMFANLAPDLAVLNIGGISNLTVIRESTVVCGFDCGPGNVLMDHWCKRHTGAAFDDRGVWGATGVIHKRLLEAMLREPYFSRGAPKSTGRDLFNFEWLERHLTEQGEPVAAVDVQATLSELTALICANDVRANARQAVLLLVCGGGTFNSHLMCRLAHHLPLLRVQTTGKAGLPATQVEACAFAWLAFEFIEGRAASLPSVTGARGPRILGALYPA